MATTWASVDEVDTITGVTVADDNVSQAQAVVDLYSNRSYDDAATISRRDLVWLKQAVAWQAAWMSEQPGYHARSDVTSINQDDDSVTFRDDRSPVLAPLAKRALRNLSWKRTRSTTVMPPWAGGSLRLLEPGQPIPEEWDDDPPWSTDRGR